MAFPYMTTLLKRLDLLIHPVNCLADLGRIGEVQAQPQMIVGVGVANKEPLINLAILPKLFDEGFHCFQQNFVGRARSAVELVIQPR